MAPEFYSNLCVITIIHSLLLQFIFNPKFTFRTRIIHNSKSDITKSGYVDVDN